MLHILKNKIFFLIIAVILIFEIIYFSNFYFRGYDTPGQESLISFFSHQAAMSNWIRNDYNFFVTKILSCEGNIEFLNNISNWPNGFFLLFSKFIKFFGNYEVIGRAYAILLSLSGVLLLTFVLSYQHQIRLLLLVPILFSTPLGLSSFNVVYVDTIFFLLIGLFLFSLKYVYLNYLIIFFSPQFYFVPFSLSRSGEIHLVVSCFGPSSKN